MPSEPEPVLRGRAATPDERARSVAVVAARNEELPRIREAASRWQAGLAGLIAIITGGSITSLGTTIRTLARGPAMAAASAVAVALLLAVIATLRALHASGGMPRLWRTDDLLLDLVDHEDARDALASLRSAVRLTLLAVASFTLAVGITWFGPRDPISPTRVLVETTDQTSTTTTP